MKAYKMISCHSQILKRSNHSSPGKLVTGRPLQSTHSLQQSSVNHSKPVHLLKLKPKRQLSVSTSSPKIRVKRKPKPVQVKELSITETQPIRVPRKRSAKRATRKPDELPLQSKSPSASASPQVRQLIRQSLQRTAEQRNEAERQAALLQQAKADRQERLKKNNDAIRKKNSLKHGKPTGVLHKSAWGVDQRRNEPADANMTELKAKRRKEREKMHREGRGRIGMANYKVPKPKQAREPEEPKKRPKSPDEDILNYMKAKRKCNRISAVAAQLDDILQANLRENALLELDCRRRTGKRKHRKDSAPLASTHPHVIEIISPRRIEDVDEDGIEWEVDAEEFVRSELVDQFKNILNEKYLEIDRRFRESREHFQLQLQNFDSADVSTSKVQAESGLPSIPVSIPDSRPASRPVSRPASTPASTPVSTPSSKREFTVLETKDESIKIPKLPLAKLELISSSDEESFVQMPEFKLPGEDSQITEHMHTPEQFATSYEHEETESAQEEGTDQSGLIVWSEDSSSIYSHESASECLDPPVQFSVELPNFTPFVEEIEPLLAECTEVQSDFSSDSVQSMSDELIQNEIENYLELISFSYSRKEVDSSLAFLHTYLHELRLLVQADGAEALECINTPGYVDPLEKLQLVQTSDPAVKVPTLELMLFQDYAFTLASQLNEAGLSTLSIYLQLLFDCVNEALNYTRPYGTTGIPPPWSFQDFRLVGESTLQQTFNKLQKLLEQWHNIQGGILPVIGPAGIDDDELQQLREDRMSVLLCVDAVQDEPKWLDFEDETLQVSLDVSNRVLQALFDELAQITSEDSAPL